MPPYHYRCAGYCNIPPTTDAPKGVSHRSQMVLVKLDKHALAMGTNHTWSHT